MRPNANARERSDLQPPDRSAQQFQTFQPTSGIIAKIICLYCTYDQQHPAFGEVQSLSLAYLSAPPDCHSCQRLSHRCHIAGGIGGVVRALFAWSFLADVTDQMHAVNARLDLSFFPPSLMSAPLSLFSPLLTILSSLWEHLSTH